MPTIQPKTCPNARTERCAGKLFADEAQHVFFPRLEHRGDFVATQRADGFSENVRQRKHGPAEQGSAEDHFDRDRHNRLD